MASETHKSSQVPESEAPDRYEKHLVIIAHPQTPVRTEASRRNIYPLIAAPGTNSLPSFASFVIRVSGPVHSWETDFVAQKSALTVKVPYPGNFDHMAAFQMRHYKQYHQDDWYYDASHPDPIARPRRRVTLSIEVQKTSDTPVKINSLSNQSSARPTAPPNTAVMIGLHNSGSAKRKRRRHHQQLEAASKQKAQQTRQ